MSRTVGVVKARRTSTQLTSSVQHDRILSKFGQQQLVMMNYARSFNQSEKGKIFWMNNNKYYYFMLRLLVLVGIRSFVLVSVSLFWLNLSWRGTGRYICVSILLIYQMMIDLESLLMPISGLVYF